MYQPLIKTGRFLYATGIVAVGLHQLLLNDFRPEILPPFPAWAHSYKVFPIFTSIALIFAALAIRGSFAIQLVQRKRICLWLGIFFLFLTITCHLPYILLMSSYKLSRLDVWFPAGEALAYSGGALVMAGSFPSNTLNGATASTGYSLRRLDFLLEQCIPLGRIFFATLMIVFGCSHFVFPAFVSTMVPKWIGMPMFWTYFVGVALIASGIAIVFKVWIKPAALLLAFMLLLFFVFFHLPDAIENASTGKGNEIVRAIIALLFTGVAIVIGLTNDGANNTTTQKKGVADKYSPLHAI